MIRDIERWKRAAYAAVDDYIHGVRDYPEGRLKVALHKGRIAYEEFIGITRDSDEVEKKLEDMGQEDYIEAVRRVAEVDPSILDEILKIDLTNQDS